MGFKIILLCVFVLINSSYGFVKGDVEQTTSNNIVGAIQRNIDRFRDCMDKTIATAVSEVNEKQLEPVLSALGDQLNRFSKAFDVLTAPTSVSKQT